MPKKRGTTIVEEIPQRVKKLRTERGLTQEGLCEAAGLSLDAVTRIEQGSRVPTLLTLEKLAGALRMRTTDLLGDDPPPPTLTGSLNQIVALLRNQPATMQRNALGLIKILLRAAK